MNSFQPARERDEKFLYLNRDNQWPGFTYHGLGLRADGALQLQTLPLLAVAVDDDSDSTANRPDGPAGLATDSAGNIYLSDPASARILELDVCDGTFSAIPCIGTQGTSPGQLNRPRGLLVPKHRSSLFTCDSGNSRVQAFDLATNRLVEVWGPRLTLEGSNDEEIPGTFDCPWDLAGDRDGNVYVVDYGNRCVQKFDRAGQVVKSFARNVLRSAILTKPANIAIAIHRDLTRVYVLDEALQLIFVFDQDGNPVLNSQADAVSFGAGRLIEAMGLAADGDHVFVGDNNIRRVLQFSNYEFVGEAIGYRGFVAALAVDEHRSLLIHNGTPQPPHRLAIDKGYRSQGVLWSGPLEISEIDVKWHGLRLLTAPLASGSHLRVFVHTSNDENDGPLVAADDPAPFQDSRWIPLETIPDPFGDVSDLFITSAPSRFLWVGVLFRSDRLSSPTVSQMRLDFNHKGYLEYLPAIYCTQFDSNRFLQRFLALFETFFEELEQKITNLSLLFDPHAVPREFLEWLASWLALDLEQTWDESDQRRIIDRAFDAYGRRGTNAGLLEALQLFAGVNAIVEEPLLGASWWCLPGSGSSCTCSATIRQQADAPEAAQTSILGVTSMLASSQPQGAVLGASATLDYSRLITNEEFGGSLFTDVAHQFSVLIYQSQLTCAGNLSRVQEVIEREKPAHTTYHLCIVKPELRVGFQARVGIDAVVGGPPMQSALGEGMVGTDVLVGGTSPGSLGQQSRVGIDARVG